MKKMTLEIEVDDDFEIGNCHNCPIGYDNPYNDFISECPLNGTKCPLEQSVEYFNLKLLYIYNNDFDFNLVTKDRKDIIVPCKKSIGINDCNFYETISGLGEMENIWSEANSIEGFKKDISEELFYDWEYYAKEDDSNLTNGAKKIKYYMLDTFEEVH